MSLKSIQRYGEEGYAEQLRRNKEKRRQRYHSDKAARQARIASNLLWQKNNPDKSNAFSHARRALARAGGRYTSEDIAVILTEQGYQCPGCLCKFSDEKPYTIDHFVPLSRGGSNYPENIHLLCLSCNTSKHSKLWNEWMG